MDSLKITLTSKTDSFKRVVFTWDADMQACDYLALEVSDDTIDAMVAAKANEGADFPGYTTEIA